MRITIDIDFGDLENPPTPEQVEEWIDFTIGANGQMSGNNPMDDLQLWDFDVDVTAEER